MIAESAMHSMANNGMKGSVTTVTENMRSSSAGVINGPSTAQEGVAQELGMLLKNHSRLDPTLKRKDSAPNRSGSAPPTVEGSLVASTANPFSLNTDSANHFATSGSSVIDSEQELRSDPAYLAYYYSHINLNPRLPPPIISQKNYLLAQRLANGGFVDKKKANSVFDDNNNSRSLFSAQPLLPTHKEENELSEDGKTSMSSLLRQASDTWMDGELDGSRALHGLSARPKSLVDLIQQDFPRTPSPVYNQTRLPSHVAKEEIQEGASGLDSTIPTAAVADLNATLSAFNTTIDESSYKTSTSLNFSLPTRNPSGVQALGKFSLGSSSGMLGTVARIPAPDSLKMADEIMDELSGMSQTRISSGKDDVNATGVAKLAASFQGLSFSNSQTISSVKSQDSLGISLESQKLHDAQKDAHPRLFQHAQQRSQRSQALQNHSQVPQYDASSLILQQQQGISSEQISMSQTKLPESHNNNLAANNAYAAASYITGNGFYANPQTPGLLPSQYGMSGYLINLPSKYTSAIAQENTAGIVAGMGAQSLASGLDMNHLYKNVNHSGASSQSRLHDPLYLHYLQQLAADDGHGPLSTSDPSLLREYLAAKHVDQHELQKAKQNALFSYPSDYRSQFTRTGSHGIPIGSKIGSVSPVYYGSPPGSGFVMPFGNSSFTAPVLPDSPVVPGAVPLRHARAAAAGIYAGWQGQKTTDLTGDLKCSSLLEELKNSKTRRFELGDIVNHVVEFSVDQHGSRFIQQKLEVASPEEKNLVFEEVLPRSLTLMTDVFGNYVIQKFFEHGSPEQRAKLASKLIGHVLDLSLQMYGCRVIQKALEVVDVDQQVQIVSELDGHVMRCVRDQNGNHVIQKCIECVPTQHIEFIISACYGHVVMLSTHPYGCRVIQRVLEHCTDEEKQSSIVGDILRSTCDLAQDQYGNYVVQHVLEHGKPHEKSEIMKKLAGQIVQMSQHKFASNVVEKCLEFGGPIEREILISEMLGTTDENEPLQAMMKDQYANYVVQKVLETCDDQQRELLLSRIKVHLHALKKYTYGKHIVARVEKLVAAGERRVAQTLA